MSRNFKLTLTYNGAPFCGWQVQPGQPTVQSALAAAIERITGEKTLPQGSGRTDAGVHALAQVATVALESPIPATNLVIALNDALPAAIRVSRCEIAGAEFHARHSARAKTYQYRIFRDAICPPFLADFVYHHPYPLDEPAMFAAAAEVLGEHDFTSFAAVDPDRETREIGPGEERTSNCEKSGNVRTLFESYWRRQAAELVYTVRGSGFLHHMVRNLVGSFLLVGKGTLRHEDIARIMAAKSRSANSGATAPASGLYLVSVEY